VGETERKRQRGEAEVKSGGKRQKGANRGKCKELSIEVGRDRRRDRREKERERNREGDRREDSQGRRGDRGGCIAGKGGLLLCTVLLK
jgi:hypothetical protein